MEYRSMLQNLWNGTLTKTNIILINERLLTTQTFKDKDMHCSESEETLVEGELQFMTTFKNYDIYCAEAERAIVEGKPEFME